MSELEFVQQPRVLLLVVLFPVYFVVWAALALGLWLFFRGRTPEFKWRWRTRASLLSNVVIGAFLAVLMLLMAGWLAGSLAGFVAIGIAYVNTARTTLCHHCGRGGRVSFSSSWGFCGRCGTPLRPPAPVVGPS